MVESSASAEGAPLLDRDRSSKLPTPVRAIAAFFLYLYICVGKSDGLIGFGALCVGSAVTIAVTLLVGWFGGCATMVLCFASCFCFGAGNAARGKYELASPVLLASLLLVASGILGSHFFADYVKTSSGSSIGNVGDPVTLQELGNATHNLQRAHIYLSEGEVVTQFTGEAKWCKDRIPVVNTCVNRFFCVAPIMAGPDEPSVGPMGKKTHKQSHNATDALREQYIWAWAGVEWTTSCYGVHFKHAPLRKNWEHDYKRGIGFLRNRHWDDAIHNTLKKYRLKAAPEAPMLQWVQDPTANQNWALFMGWFVEVTCVTIYLVVITTYNHCSGTSKSARPEARRFFYGPDDPIWVRYRNRTRSSRAQATSV